MKQLYKTITILVCILLFTACNGKAVDLNSNTNTSSQTSTEESSEQVDSLASVNEEVSSLAIAKAGNPDTVAWLQIPNTDIDNPVMQTSNNEDYLRRNENGKYDIWGCYFADYYSNLTSKDALLQNTVIYGHSEST